MKKLDVIIPALDVAPTIGKIVSAFRVHPEIKNIFVMVDEKTTDNTYQVASDAGATPIDSVHGKGQLIADGLSFVDTEHVILSDGDYTHFSGYAGSLLIHSAAEEWMTIIIPKQPTTAEWVLSKFPVVFSPSAWAWNSGLRVMPTEFIKSIPTLYGYLVETQLNKAAAQKGYRVSQVPLDSVHAPLHFTKQRMDDMEAHRIWGIENGVFDA